MLMAAEGNHIDILDNLCVWTEKAQLCLNELKNKFFPDKDEYGYIACHQAAR